ncbi:uncharacterized protein [Spinacia oleracea]|uniref:Uncharacterized protein n=1 Tax=Spinacia oleracea TaxID=3562 RepID=A0ABM3QW24_SPIOL|nr:uncharacterized protein LOC130462738 [Spinacia oleracea]
MKTLNDDFQVRPAHLPNVSDLFGLSEAFKFYILGVLAKLDETNSSKYIHDHVLNMVDPRPVINWAGPLYLLAGPTTIRMASYSDAVHVMEMHRDNCISFFEIFRLDHNVRSHEVFVRCENYARWPGYYHVPNWSRFVCWNVRGMVRESFIENFQIMYVLHRPVVVVILESRLSFENIDLIVERLPARYVYSTFGPVGFGGGVVVLWMDVSVSIVNGYHNRRETMVAEFAFEGIAPRPSARRRLFRGDDAGSSSTTSRDILD